MDTFVKKRSPQAQRRFQAGPATARAAKACASACAAAAAAWALDAPLWLLGGVSLDPVARLSRDRGRPLEGRDPATFFYVGCRRVRVYALG